MDLSELEQIALKQGEDKERISRALNPLRRAFFGVIERRHNIRRLPESPRGSGHAPVVSEDHERWDVIYHEYKKGIISPTVEEILEEYPEEWDRLKLRNYGRNTEKFFIYLLGKYYQPTQDTYASSLITGGEYDI